MCQSLQTPYNTISIISEYIFSRRNKEQYEIELKELAETEKATLKRYQDAQARVRQTEDKCKLYSKTFANIS